MTVLTELDNLIQILEAKIPANPNDPKNQKLEGQLQKDLAKYFGELDDAFPYQKIDRLYSKYVKESIGSDIDDMLDPLLARFDGSLTRRIDGHLVRIYSEGSVEMIKWAGLPFEGPPIKQAIDFANKHGATLVTQMDEETKRRLANTISNGILNKRGVPGLARDIRTTFSDMTKYRSELIAKTETRNALFVASHDRSVEMGIDGKEWVLGAGGAEGNCPDCLSNAGVGVIPINKEFPIPEGDIHPGCTCAIAPAMLK